MINNIKFKRYNVILILLDAVRFDHVGCYGYKRKTTPNIDRLAENGVIFENAFSHSSHTLESVPSLLTSTYPSTHNVKTITSAIPDDILTLPEIFKSYGYKTAIFSTNPYISVVYGYGKGI
ncbi:sulfatase-like hydrolase/transferase, partial [SCandidatus Aminicenantes bacterium Aminicenantia_JdfR_composite]|nr:sulfatase-like hydrolase/transferase [SCandidatus Aminicenantes bacterium Aminicenantia_JdfR_composite]